MISWICWFFSLTLVTYLSVYIIRKTPQYAFSALVGFYIIYLTTAQIVAARIIEVNLGFAVIFAPAGVLIYPFVAQVIDMINEVYGEKMTHAAILIAFASQVIWVIFVFIINGFPPAPYFAYEEAWQSIFSVGIRVTLASWISFLLCSHIDAFIFARIKEHFLAREKAFRQSTLINPYVWLRSGATDVISLTLDSVIFVVIAFLGVMPILPLVIGQIVMKNIIGFADNPWFVWYKSMLNKDPGQRCRTF
ncbi:queuosine precursor transporter [Methanospirillum hungatei]|uniref:queuosine precursor transporter n=1 Tax=Methanospirillum hungatei TaxID=2203 RepID=UPI0026EBEA3D|nr:queuosine precursor transporter [Methanospirillum hungatei]MCA1916941.1 queuosine precursor transporter [Methanospirillum hungatei]